MDKRKKLARNLKKYRKIHRTLSVFLGILFIIVSITGLLLGWKKNSNGIILPKSAKGISTNLKEWLPFNTLQTIAIKALKDSIDQNIDIDIQRIDARPEKGIVKFVFKNNYWGIQLDGATGDVLAVTKRRSDLIENIHDGSFLDMIFKTNCEILKLIYTTIIGLTLFIFTVTGFLMWHGSERIKKMNKL